MFTKKIRLFFREFELPGLKGVDIQVIRLSCEVAFRDGEGYTDSYTAILDTGAPVSVIPYAIWSKLKVSYISDYQIKGIISKQECTLPVKIGDISCVILDQKKSTKDLRIRSYLSLSDEVPLIIGFKDILDRFGVYFNYEKKVAYLEC